MKLNNFCPPQGGDLHCQEHVSAPPPLLLQWVKTDHALVMLFNNDTLQVCIIKLIKPVMGHWVYITTFSKQLDYNSPFLFFFLFFRLTSTQTTPKSSCASLLTTPTCSPISVGNVPRARTSSACWMKWAAHLSYGTALDMWSSFSSTTLMPESTAQCLPGYPSDRCLRGNLTGWYSFSRHSQARECVHMRDGWKGCSTSLSNILVWLSA